MTTDRVQRSNRRLRPSFFALAVLLILQAPIATAFAQGGGIGAQEYQQRFPQAPHNLRAALRAGKVVISWDPPPVPPPQLKLSYDPIPDHYRVYRIGAKEEQEPIGETAATSFEDAAASKGAVARYAVSAVQKSGLESGLSTTVEVRVP